ncbi:ABC-2 type transport system permease protein [Actinoplanes octamycinicus]|uniref:ABC-2 type transport system permease protein n=1 Tax=Actinoplanes octamycinicus TaxID=135948 RepID=A0A7W7GRP5_9ACTN|nr:ABC transporter permease [Actinoplanes octamycinicus]MBB4737076.1 ABC-2 type transport system permease protein [Actinoplanes octamycinicus]GIE63375.1 transport permease protein [Actinoplanes octamycinicus]
MTPIVMGLRRGWIEIRHTFTTPIDLWAYLFPTVLLLGTVFFMRNSTVPGTSFSLGARTLPSVFGMGLVLGGLMTTAQQLIVDREDGTLLRAKAVPDGMRSYLTGKVVLVGGMTLVGFLLQLVPGLFLVDGLSIDAGGWLTLLWLVPLGFLATLPLGAAIGSLFDDPRNMALVTLPLFGAIAISGIFYPITGFPGWLQGLAQVFPLYWLGLGMRSVFLPDALAAVEIGQSWRHLETFGVLTVWALIGMVLAPVLLRRMARRESGSAVAARRERALSRVGR